MSPLVLPDLLLQNVHAVHDAAEVWRARLPETLAGLEARWQLRVTGLAPGLSFDLVTYAERADGTRCVLKLSPPFEDLMMPDVPQRNYEVREVFDALRWLVRTGAAWRYLPGDFPPMVKPQAH